MNPIFLNIIAFLLALNLSSENIIIEYDEAEKAFNYLNRVRAAPAAFSEEIGVDLTALEPRAKLIWNDTLALVAQKKAVDMAKRDYFSHITPDGKGINLMIAEAGYPIRNEWLTNDAGNIFESLASGYDDGISVIKGLIKDEGVPDAGHRRHLLGAGIWNGSLKECGIGFAVNPETYYGSYICIIIAKKGFNE